MKVGTYLGSLLEHKIRLFITASSHLVSLYLRLIGYPRLVEIKQAETWHEFCDGK
jgi:hypothetical protein